MTTPEKPNEQLTSAPNKEQEFIDKASKLKETNDTEVASLLNEVMKANLSQEAAKNLLNAIPTNYYENGEIKQGTPEGIEDLINFLEPIANQMKQLEVDTSEVAASDPASQDKLTDADMAILRDSFGRIKKFQDEIGKDNDPRLQALNNTLKNIKKVFEKPTKGYINQLQKFIYESCYKNLPDNDDGKKTFKEKNGMLDNGDFEIQDTETLIVGLNELLNLIEKNIQDIQEAIAVEKSHSVLENDASGASATVSSGVDATGAQTLDATPSNPDVSKLKTELPGGYQIISGAQISGIAGVALYNTEPQQVEAQQAVDEGGADENKKLEQNRVSDAVDQLKLLGLSEGSKEEKIYLMEVGDKTLAVRLDSAGCLYPFAVDVSNSGGNRLVFLKNNTSCIKYLENKLNDKVPNNDAYIVWNGTRYVIGINGDHQKSRLLIEPTTIAGQWVSPDLGRSLAFLNFTNYLRNKPGLDGFAFRNDNPDLKWEGSDLYVRVKKMDKDKMEKEDLSRRWKHVDLEDFGLNGISEDSDEWRQFIKYNNSEQWNSYGHFDRLNKKFDYDTLDIQARLRRQQSRARASGASGSIERGSSSVSPRIESGSHRQDNLLLAVENEFDLRDFGINGNGTAYGLENGFLYVEGKNVIKLSGCVRQTATLPEGTSLQAGQPLPDNLDFKDTTLSVCKAGADDLNHRLKDIYKNVSDDSLPDGVAIAIEDNNYVLKIDDSKSITLGEEKFVNDNKILGYPIDKPEEWMKVVCYAYQNYEDIVSGKQLVLNNSNEYGITDSNKDGVAARLQSLVTSDNTEKPDLVILPGSESIGSFNGEGEFVTVDGVIDGKKSLKINGIEYSCTPEEGLGYKFFKNSNNISSFYLGEFLGGKASGYGISIWSNGRKYEGNWVEGEMSGKGVFTWENGKKYEGNWVGGEMSGKGVYTWKDGSKYEGNWVGGEMSGKGVYTWKSGAQLECSCDDGVIKGGRITMTVNGEQKVFNVEGLINTKNGRDNTHFKINSDDEYNGRIISRETGVLFSEGHQAL